MKPQEIFISYKSEEFEDALWVKNILESNGLSCWMAPMCISGGASYATEIPHAIKNCKILVLILSKNAQESKWVPRELDQAINSDKLIMPFALDDCPLKSDFEFYLSNVQRYSAYLDKEATMAKMLEDIKNYLGYPEPEDAPLSIPTVETNPQPKIELEQDDAVASPSTEKHKAPAKVKSPNTPKMPRVSAGKKNRRVGKIIIPVVISVAVILSIIIGSLALHNLNKLEIAGTVFSKIDYSIHIENKEITSNDMETLSKFVDLSFIEFTNCTFKTDNLSAITKHDLYSLTLSNCSLTDAQLASLNFDALEGLTELNLNGNKEITNLKVLSPLADSLKTLHINATSPSSLEVIENFTKLRQLSLSNVGIADLGIIRNMAYLEELEADGNNIKNLNGLENTSILRKVSLNRNQISDVSVLAKSAKTLNYLFLDDNTILDLSALADCKNIIEFSARSNKLTSIKWLSEWKSLQTLVLSGNKIKNINGFIKCDNLTYIDLSNNQIAKIENVTFAKSGYIKANFSNNAITAARLPNDCHFTLLALHGNPLRDFSFLREAEGTDVSLTFFDTLNKETLKAANFYNIYIADCPTNRKVEIETASYAVQLTTADKIDALLSK